MSDVVPQPRPQGSGLSKRVGPLPLWGWGVVLLAVIAFYVYKSKKTQAAQNTASSSGTSAVYDASGQQIGTLSVDPQSTPLQVGDHQGQGRQAAWNVDNTTNGQTAASQPAADSLSSSETDGATPAVNTTTPATAPAQPS
jgi:hypothetical protein